MLTLIRYELKKIFQSKIFLGCFVLAIIGIFVFASYLTNMYRNGISGEYSMVDMQGKKIPETYVSSSNIDMLRHKLDEFEANDSIYADINSECFKNGGTRYYGKYEVNYPELTLQMEKGEITEEEMLSKMGNIKFAIKKEYLPEYLSLYIPVNKYDKIKIGLEENRIDAKNSSTQEEKLRYTLYAEEKEKALNDGFTVGYDYGWENIFFTLSINTGIILGAIIVFGLCNVFTGEYSSGADSLLLTGKRGKGRLAFAKLMAAMIYTFICCVVYILMTVIINFAFLGNEGANVGISQSNIERLFSIAPFIFLGCILLALITLAVSSATSKPITSVGVSFLFGLFPLFVTEYGSTKFPKIMPINMLFGNYIQMDEFVYFNGGLHDIRSLFLLVALVITIVCIPIMFIAYCRRQVKS